MQLFLIVQEIKNRTSYSHLLMWCDLIVEVGTESHYAVLFSYNERVAVKLELFCLICLFTLLLLLFLIAQEIENRW